MERKVGTVYSSNPKGWVFIYTSPQDKYFGHLTQLGAFAALPKVGDRVTFRVGPPRNPNQLPCALDIRPEVAQ